ncbi:MAG: FKBP-type peptidyl-prolyl cis-trans isomerase [Bacteroidaceae bacterium]|nr:FKBP-type peptidyl-prolyl cis-trans isomerase [Bacteroidaceae bacterium]
MAKNSKEKYRIENEIFMENLLNEEGVNQLPKGILYKVINERNGKQAQPRSVVSVYYKGSLIDGKVFDDNTQQGYPDAFRLTDLIVAWQIAIPQMKEGDKWQIFVPSELGYGKRGTHGIPGNSTLIFEIELVKVM